MNETFKKQIENGECTLGIELGSTRIKAVLINSGAEIVAIGTYDWENRFENGIWTYSLEDIFAGTKGCYKSLKNDVFKIYGVTLKKLASLGISAMMHGYIVLDKEDNLLSPFRTWRNTTAGAAAEFLTEEFDFNIPERWSIAHFWHQVTEGAEHVKHIDKLMPLSCYVHYLLSGEFVLGIGDASGMFPAEAAETAYSAKLINKMDKLMAEKGLPYKAEDILPKLLSAGDDAGFLTEKGAKFLDEEGDLEAGIPMCPPEGDAGTGMVATNSVRPATGNVSAGTSVFAMIVLEKELEKLHREIDVTATPAGAPVAMVHCNNCSSELNVFADMFSELGNSLGVELDRGKVLGAMFSAAEKGAPDCGGTVSCNYLSGEFITGFQNGIPLVARTPESSFSLADFSRSLIYSAFATVKIGMYVLDEEKVRIERMTGHGGLFKSPFAAKAFAAATKAEVVVMKNAGEGGAWGIAVLASYMVNREEGEKLEDYLENKVFAEAEAERFSPEKADVEGYDSYIETYKKLLTVERAAVENL